jgi:DNA-binding SARP family transcriptional activator
MRGHQRDITPSCGPDVWLRLIGQFAAYRAGRALPAIAVGSRKTRTLLALLAIHRGRWLSVNQIIEVLWDDLPRQPVNNIATLISRLRGTLGRDIVVGGRDGYRLGDRTQVDLHVAAKLVDVAETRLAVRQPGQALAAARRAVDLLDDKLAVPDDGLWAALAHRLHTEALRRARHTVAEAALDSGLPHAAQAAAADATAADPIDEAGYRLLMRAHDAAGEPARALVTYQRLRTTLSTELGVDPAAPSRDLHAAILRGNAAPDRGPRPY